MKKKFEARYIVTSVVSVPVYKVFGKTEAYKEATKPGWGIVVDWDGAGKEKNLVCDDDSSASIYTKNGGYFGIFPMDEIKSKDVPKQAACAAILTSDSCGCSFWTEDGQIRIFVTYDENGLIDTYRMEYGPDAQPYDGETEISFEDLYERAEDDWKDTYRAKIPGTLEYQNKQEAAAVAAEAGATWMDEAQQEDFRRICAMIDTIKNGRDFYRVMGLINAGDFGVDVINAARKFKQCFNSAQYEPDAPSAGTLVALAAEAMQEAASKGQEAALGTPEKMAGTDATQAAEGHQPPPQVREINLGEVYATTRPEAGDGLRVIKREPP